MIPQAFQKQMCALLGDNEAGALCTALSSGNLPTSIRTNPFKPLKDGENLFRQTDNAVSPSDNLFMVLFIYLFRDRFSVA